MYHLITYNNRYCIINFAENLWSGQWSNSLQEIPNKATNPVFGTLAKYPTTLEAYNLDGHPRVYISLATFQEPPVVDTLKSTHPELFI